MRETERDTDRVKQNRKRERCFIDHQEVTEERERESAHLRTRACTLGVFLDAWGRGGGLLKIVLLKPVFKEQFI